MSGDRHKEIFFESLELDDAARHSFIEERCGHDAELLARVQRLLASHESAGRFMSSPTRKDVRTAPPDGIAVHPGERPGDELGAYRLLAEIGEGGFGKVFLAEQHEPVRRRVAIKIVKLGMDTDQVIARFQAERQALAMMDHPGIAKVFDAGATTTGRPYFVMEYVPGESVTTFCDRYRLSLPERLELFVDICRVVQHAHQKGIIHRDLKPGNVLVTRIDGRPAPKVIDFGIAKAAGPALSDQTLTHDLQILGTPEYMSPEQAGEGGLDVDTRSDVYALGVLLYELLTGASPFDRRRLQEAGHVELLRIIREEDPPRPSTRLGMLGEDLPAIAERRAVDQEGLRRALRGDLDWIVLKAMEKDRARRYETAAALANDIVRFLRAEPVVARPPSTAYLVAKFVRRHRVTVVAAAVVAVALVVGLVGTTIGLWQASRQRDVARSALDEAEQALWDSYLAQARASRSTNRPGRRFAALEVLGRAAALRPTAELRDEAIACMALSDVQMLSSFPGLVGASISGLEEPTCT
ncbi:MAG: serine/threonine-protein kinase [Planctomycetota bacterium]|jgi:serine/threonine protein kinase